MHESKETLHKCDSFLAKVILGFKFSSAVSET